MESKVMRILIADDHAMVRQGLRSLIEDHGDAEVVGEAPDGRNAVRLAQECCPDVVIMDVTMPNLNGIEATRQICRQNPNVKVIVLSMHTDKGLVRAALKAGALAYVLKSCLFEDLQRALDTVARGAHYLSPRITDLLVRDYMGNLGEPAGPDPGALTPTECQILQLVAEGQTVKQIARLLDMSPKTVDARRRHLMHKLDVSSIADLVKWAIRAGLTSLDF